MLFSGLVRGGGISCGAGAVAATRRNSVAGIVVVEETELLLMSICSNGKIILYYKEYSNNMMYLWPPNIVFLSNLITAQTCRVINRYWSAW